eukprot:TRINITY_DN58951_c0_g1_i1.p2 TRINITY_DN58951_c0_g1~~TRINITY_DN58951_c0_g1_i1.p2  ORF type:complete len:146 (+),score=22.83 TRINITY_DN58951_c0_g1_i1:120-557(+)
MCIRDRMWIINLENIIWVYFILLSASALTTLCSSTTRSFAEYGKQSIDWKGSSILHISKKHHFGHMYIFAFLLDLFVLYEVGRCMISGEKSPVVSFLSQNAGEVDVNNPHVLCVDTLSLIHISEPTRPLYISYAVFCLKKKTPYS